MILGGMTQNCTPPDIQSMCSIISSTLLEVASGGCSKIWLRLLTRSTVTQSSITKLCPQLGDSRTPVVVIVMAFITTLALISVALRIVSRKLGRIRFGWDDWLIIFAMVCVQRPFSDFSLLKLSYRWPLWASQLLCSKVGRIFLIIHL